MEVADTGCFAVPRPSSPLIIVLTLSIPKFDSNVSV